MDLGKRSSDPAKSYNTNTVIETLEPTKQRTAASGAGAVYGYTRASGQQQQLKCTG